MARCRHFFIPSRDYDRFMQSHGSASRILAARNEPSGVNEGGQDKAIVGEWRLNVLTSGSSRHAHARISARSFSGTTD